MDFDYHLKLVTNSNTGYDRTAHDLDLVEQAKTLYPSARTAMQKVVEDGDYQSYVKGIEPYDRFIWHHSHLGDKSNIFAYKKIKVSPSWTEQIWAPVFERVRRQMADHWQTGELRIIQNTQVVESFSDQGPSGFKDVDNGIAVTATMAGSYWEFLMPVVVVEDKTGHFCKTACTGVDAIIRRVKAMNPKVLAFVMTDNNVSVGRDSLVENVFGAGGVLISQRGKNNSREDYPPLHADRFQTVERLCLNYLRDQSITDFLNIQNAQPRGQSLRESIDQDGRFVPEPLRQYLV